MGNDNLGYKNKYALVVTGSLNDPDCKYNSPECSNDDYEFSSKLIRYLLQ